MCLDPETTAVIVVDMQNDFLEEGALLEAHMAREFVDDLATFVYRCREAGASTVFTGRSSGSGCDPVELGDLSVPDSDERPLLRGSEGSELYGPLVPQEGDVVEKHRYSAFCNTELETVLLGLDVDTV